MIIKKIRWDEASEIMCVTIAGYEHREFCFDPKELIGAADLENQLQAKMQEVDNLQPSISVVPDISEYTALIGAPGTDLFRLIIDTYAGKPVHYMETSEIVPLIEREINEELKADMLENGMLDPLEVRRSDNVCQVGNQRLAILKLLNIEEVPVVFLSKK